MPLTTGPTPDFNQVTLKWAGVNLDGTPCTGSLSLTYNSNVPLLDDDPAMPVSIYPVELTKTLTTATIQVKNDVGVLVTRNVGYAEWNVPASDDPDIQGFGGTYTLVEKLANGKGQTRNFVASGNTPDGVIWLNKITSVTPVAGQAISAVSVAQVNQMQAQIDALLAAGPGGGGTFSGVPNDGSVTNTKVATNAAISADKLADGTTNKVMTQAERARLAGMQNGATANSTDAILLNRGNHNGVQQASSISDFTEAAEDVIGGVAIRMGGSYDDPNGRVYWPGTIKATLTAVPADAAAYAAAGILDGDFFAVTS